MTFTTTKCRHCGIEFRFPKEYGTVLYCSAMCRVANLTDTAGVQYKGCTKSKYYSKKRRKVIAAGDKIDPYVVYVANNWKCCICEGDIDAELKPPDLWAATLEHVLDIGSGGTHTWDNVSCAHAWCNFNKHELLPKAV